MNTRVLLLAGLLFALSSAAQDTKRELWMWKDANGVTHYSDRPSPGARKVQLSHVHSPDAEAPAVPASPEVSRSELSGSTEEDLPEAPVDYRRLEFLQPGEGQTFFGPDASVDVSLRTEPELAQGHRLALFLDGTQVGRVSGSLSYAISNLVRGTHTLTAVIQDERGNELLRSQPRTFNVRQPTTIPPAAVGPGLRPPPKPAPRPNPSG